MTCTTCGSIYGQLAKATSESKTPTWECVNGHRQPWGEDAADVLETCICRRCLMALPDGAFPPLACRVMVVCETCGNKRCPHAEWHGYECTHSNEPNQTPVLMTGLRPARPALSVEQDALAEAAIVLEALYASVRWELAPAMKEQIAVAVLKVRKALGVGK